MLLSIGYYYSLNYDPLKDPKEISRIKYGSLMIAFLFSVLFVNVLASPVINAIILAINLPIEKFWILILRSIISLAIIYAYLILSTIIIYKTLIVGIDHEK